MKRTTLLSLVLLFAVCAFAASDKLVEASVKTKAEKATKSSVQDVQQSAPATDVVTSNLPERCYGIDGKLLGQTLIERLDSRRQTVRIPEAPASVIDHVPLTGY